MDADTRSKTVICSMTVSVDGYVADAGGGIDWGPPDGERHAFNVAQIGELSAYLLGRRLYETMLPVELDPSMRSTPEASDFAEIWAAIPKVVFSTTLDEVEGNARLAEGSIADELARAPDGIISVGGAMLAAQCIELGLIDEFRMFVVPVLLGGGTPYFPNRATPLELELLETRTFPRSLYQCWGRARSTA